MIYRIESTLLECEEQTKDEVMESVFVQQIKRMKNERNYFLTRTFSNIFYVRTIKENP